MKNPLIKNTLILTMITLVAGLFLGLVYEITKEPIAAAQEAAKQAAYKEVFADASSFVALDGFEVTVIDGVNTIDEVVIATDGTNDLGCVITITNKEAYGGSLQLTMGIRMDGTVNGISFLSLSETAGLGMNAKESFFTDQFANKLVSAFTVTKTGATVDGEIDALSGATITSSAVATAVNAGITYFDTTVGGGANE
ncbi:MAG: RnfABCDGE type electron transport complex subunit G [Lachnospiraceae bacterium]